MSLYGLLLFYGLTKEELDGRRPLAKFLSIKLIVMFTYYQTFVVSVLISYICRCLTLWIQFSILSSYGYITGEESSLGAPRLDSLTGFISNSILDHDECFRRTECADNLY